MEQTERKRKENESSVRVRERGEGGERGGGKPLAGEGIRSRKERRPGEWDIERRRDADPRKPWRHATRQLLLPRSKPCSQSCGPHRLLVFPDLRRVFLILFARTKTCSPHALARFMHATRSASFHAYFYPRLLFFSLSLSVCLSICSRCGGVRKDFQLLFFSSCVFSLGRFGNWFFNANFVRYGFVYVSD